MRPVSTVRGVVWLLATITLVSSPVAVEAQNAAPVVTNVAAIQLSNSGVVQITYDVTDAEADSVMVSVYCSTNGGTSYNLRPISVSGDVNRRIYPGFGKVITWNAVADYPGQYWEGLIARVYASDRSSVGGEMVFVPAGPFLMGNNSGPVAEQPQHTVTLDAFYIDKYEVTCGEFNEFILAGGYDIPALWSPEGYTWRNSWPGHSQPQGWNSVNHQGPSYPGFPVIVTWYEAEAYANFVRKRLPTEAEWEKAARGTDARTFPWGENIDPSRANYFESNDPYEYPSQTSYRITPAGYYNGALYASAPPFQTTNTVGPYGAYDQAGNLSEWVKDWFGSTYYLASPSSNPPGPVNGDRRVLRGGGYYDPSAELYCARRVSPYPNETGGFRCAKNP